MDPGPVPGSVHMDQYIWISTYGLVHMDQYLWISAYGSVHMDQCIHVLTYIRRQSFYFENKSLSSPQFDLINISQFSRPHKLPLRI